MGSSAEQTQGIFSDRACRSRREFVIATAGLAAGAVLLSPLAVRAQASSVSNRKMKICLTPGSIGVSTNQTGAITLAERHGFEAVEPFGSQLAELAATQLDDLVASLKAKNLVWGAAGLPVEFRQDESRFNDG